MAKRYLEVTNDADIHWAFIRAVMQSVANLAVIPMQDLLGLGTEARMNVPSTVGPNWQWRLTPGSIDDARIVDRLSEMVLLYDRSSQV